MRKTIFALLSLVALGGVLFLVMPINMQDELKDGLKRPFTPNFELPPNQMKAARQDDWIAEYRRRGYELNCVGNLRPEEKASPDDDYNCWGIIKSAYDNIPARMIVFWFRKGELQNIKIEFPESSFASLQDFLGRHFSGVKRLDQSASAAFGTDVYGKPLMVWPTDYGVVVASNTSTPGQSLTLLWVSKEKLMRDVMERLLSRATISDKPSLQMPSTPPPVNTTLHSEALVATKPVNPVPTSPVQAYQPPSTRDNVIADPKTLQPKKRKPSDLRYCLDLQTNDAIAKCANELR